MFAMERQPVSVRHRDFHRSSNGYVTDTMSRYQAVSFEDSERLKLERFIDRLNMFQAGLFTPFGDINLDKRPKNKGCSGKVS